MKNIGLKVAVIILMLAAIGFNSCGEKADKDQIPFTRIGEGDGLHGFREDRIITSQEEWDDLLMSFEKYEMERFSETEIDFDRYVIIAVADKTRPSTGWSIFVRYIKEYPDKIVVTTDVRVPQGYQGDAMTWPYCIAKMPVTEKKIEFVHLN